MKGAKRGTGAGGDGARERIGQGGNQRDLTAKRGRDRKCRDPAKLRWPDLLTNHPLAHLRNVHQCES